MKMLIFKVILILGIALGGVNYFLYLNTGKGMFNDISSIEMPSFMPSKDLFKSAVNIDSSNKEELYKWTDSQGRVHYSSEAPAGSSDVKELILDPNLNVVQAIQSTESESNTSKEQEIRSDEIGSVEKLIHDAKEVQTLVDDRTKRLEKATN